MQDDLCTLNVFDGRIAIQGDRSQGGAITFAQEDTDGLGAPRIARFRPTVNPLNASVH